MYRIYADDALIATSENGLDVINPVLTLEENAAGSLEFTFPVSHPYYDYLVTNKTIISVYSNNDENPRWKGFVTDTVVDFRNNKKIVCTGFLSLLTQTVLPQKSYSAVTPRALLEDYIAEHNSMIGDDRKKFTVGTVTVTDSNNAITCFTNFNSVWTEIKEDLIDDLGGLLLIRYEGNNNYLDLLEASPKTSSQTVEFGLNLLDLEVQYQAGELCTIVYPIGARLDDDKRTSSAIEGLDEYVTIKSVNNGVNYLSDQNAINRYGAISKVVKFDDVHEPSILKTKGQKYLQQTQFENMMVEASAVDLSAIGQGEPLGLSDTVLVRSDPHGVNANFRITRIVNYLAEPAKDKFTLGKSTFRQLTGQVSSTSSKMEVVIKENQGGSASSSGSSGSGGSSGTVSGSKVTVTRVLTEGTKIATLTVDGTAYELFAPSGGASLTSMEGVEF